VSDAATRTRFLAAIADQLPIDRVVEVHLFGALRQGGLESGVAVVAVDPHDPQPLTSLLDDGRAGAEPDSAPPAAEAADAVEADAPLPVQSLDAVLHEAVVRADGEVIESLADDSPYAVEAAPAETAADETGPTRRVARFTVYSARYRHTLKGPERGKWEVSVTEEADAPLLTVSAVVRGVSRRSGEADETVRLSGDEFRAALADPALRPPVAPAARPTRARV
jgi:hypothetical protein